MNSDLSLGVVTALAGFVLKTTLAFGLCLFLSRLVNSPGRRFLVWLSFLYGSTGYWLFLAKGLFARGHLTVVSSSTRVHSVSPAAWQIVHDAPGLEDLWQLHYAEESAKNHNVDPDHIANVKEHCEGAFLKVSAQSDGSYTLTNSRTGVTKSYSSREQDHPAKQ